jgi:DedD protein
MMGNEGMRTVFEEEEEDLAPLEEQDDRELTLSSTTLLVIFFGLVLVCGLFFGLGYTLGHRSSTSAAERESGTTPVSETPAPISAAASFDSKPKPSPSAPTAVVADPAPVSSTDDTQAASTSSDTPSQPQPQTVKLALEEAKPVAPVQAAKVSAQPAATPASIPTGIMVQIAAVSNPADANVLIGALQKHGYTVAARRQPTDTLIHVQIGPFPTRADAVAMRQKLLGDGYNAIIK